MVLGPRAHTCERCHTFDRSRRPAPRAAQSVGVLSACVVSRRVRVVRRASGYGCVSSAFIASRVECVSHVRACAQLPYLCEKFAHPPHFVAGVNSRSATRRERRDIRYMREGMIGVAKSSHRAARRASRRVAARARRTALPHRKCVEYGDWGKGCDR